MIHIFFISIRFLSNPSLSLKAQPLTSHISRLRSRLTNYVAWIFLFFSSYLVAILLFLEKIFMCFPLVCFGVDEARQDTHISVILLNIFFFRETFGFFCLACFPEKYFYSTKLQVSFSCCASMCFKARLTFLIWCPNAVLTKRENFSLS